MLAKCLIRPKGAQEKCRRNHETPSVQKKHQNNLAINSSRSFLREIKLEYTRPKPENAFPVHAKILLKKKNISNSQSWLLRHCGDLVKPPTRWNS